MQELERIVVKTVVEQNYLGLRLVFFLDSSVASVITINEIIMAIEATKEEQNGEGNDRLSSRLEDLQIVFYVNTLIL